MIVGDEISVVEVGDDERTAPVHEHTQGIAVKLVLACLFVQATLGTWQLIEVLDDGSHVHCHLPVVAPQLHLYFRHAVSRLLSHVGQQNGVACFELVRSVVEQWQVVLQQVVVGILGNGLFRVYAQLLV